MTNGGGQLIILRAVTSAGAVSPFAKLYHYDPGTVDTANIYSDEALTSALAQPFISNSAGEFVFYARDDFDMLIKDADDVTLVPLDDFHISKGELIQYGTAYPAANLLSKGMPFLVIDSNNELRNFGINKYTEYVSLYEADANGNRLFDKVIPKTHPYYDITAYGAIAGEALDQSARIQVAIDAIAVAGWGILYIPIGRFQVDSSLTINNTGIYIMGSGGGSVLVQTSDPSAPLFDFGTTDITDECMCKNFRIETAVSGSNTAIDCLWPSTSSEDSLKNCHFENVYIGPTAAATATAYFSNAIIVSDAKKMDCINVSLRGHDSLDTVMVGLLLNGYTENTTISNLRAHHMLTGVETTANVVGTFIGNGSNFKGQTTGILLGACSKLKIGDCIFEKEADSTVNWYGINGDTSIFTIANNIFTDNGSASGTDRGINLDTASIGMVNNNVFNGLNIDITLTSNSGTITACDNRGTVANNNNTNIVYNNMPITASIPAFTSADTTPSVIASGSSSGKVHYYITANAGATSITNFDDGYLGQMIIVRANDANTTLVHNMSLIVLQGGVNFVMASGNVITLIKDPIGPWVEISRNTDAIE